jgi:hypothetical protein
LQRLPNRDGDGAESNDRRGLYCFVRERPIILTVPFSIYQRKVVQEGFSVTPLGELTDVSLPEGSVITFEVNPAMCRRRGKLIFEYLGVSFTAPGWLVHDKTEPADSTMVG